MADTATPKKNTVYRIYDQDDQGILTPLIEVSAKTPDDAIKESADSLMRNTDRTLVIVPVRYVTEKTIRTVTTTKVVID